MPFENPNVGGSAADWIWAGVLAFLGRVVVLANLPTRPGGWALLISLAWEIPVACAFAAIGLGLVQWSRLEGNIAGAAIVAIAYAGPRTISFALARWLSPRPPAL